MSQDGQKTPPQLEELLNSSSNKVENSSTKTQTDNANPDDQPQPVGTVVIEERASASMLDDVAQNGSNQPDDLDDDLDDQLAGTQAMSTTPTTRANLEPSATVKVVLLPMNQVVTLACSLRMTIGELRVQFSIDLKIEPQYLQFIHASSTNDTKGILPDDHVRLSDLGVEPNGIIQLKIQSLDQINFPLKSYEPKEKFLAPDVITVHVDLKNNQFKELIVEIERTAQKKPFLGGFKNKFNGKEFFNASCQTVKPLKINTDVQKFCRDTQTIVSNHIQLQTRQDMSTQMTKPGVFVSRVKDKLITPRPYQTAAELHEIRVNSVITIQKYFRRWYAKRRFNEIRMAYDERVRWEKEKEMKRLKDVDERRQNDVNRRLNPKTKDDFEILYSALEKWRFEELSKINATKTGAARKAALAMLVDQEAELIGTIERYKIEASKENKEKQIQQLLERMAKPKIWKYKDGSTTELDSPYNIRARELKDIYNSLNMNYLTQDERLDVLLTLKHTVKEHDCKLTQEIISLIDREADLLMRGIREENIQGLRKRIATLFFQYIKTPQFNPAAAKHIKAPQDLLETKIESFFCKTCERYLPSIEFQVSSSSSKVGKCKNCKNLENLALKRIDFTKFKYLLQRIQKDEQSYGPNSKMCYLVNDRDIQYMFESIWNSQSILSASNDIYQLIFVRWNKDEEWTPWNTILLTAEEAESHLKLKNLDLSYGEQFLKKIKQRHGMARNHFGKLPSISAYLSKSDYKEELHLPSLTGIKIN